MNEKYRALQRQLMAMKRDDREYFLIEFADNWNGFSMTTFLLFFDIYNENKTLIADVTPENTTIIPAGTYYYSFKDPELKWSIATTEDNSLHNLFFKAKIFSIQLPQNFGENTSVDRMLTENRFYNSSGIRNPENLTSIRLHEDWGSVTSAESMCENTGITSIILPQAWKNDISVKKMFNGCTNLNDVTLPSDWSGVIESWLLGFGGAEMFTNTGFTSKAPGILIAPGYYKSPAPGVFPEECYRDDIGLPF